MEEAEGLLCSRMKISLLQFWNLVVGSLTFEYLKEALVSHGGVILFMGSQEWRIDNGCGIIYVVCGLCRENHGSFAATSMKHSSSTSICQDQLKRRHKC